MVASIFSRKLDLVAVDVDGTLLDSHHQISDGAAQAFETLAAAGIMGVLVSGRSYLLLQDIIECLTISPYYIGSGGACVARTTGEIIALNPVSRTAAEKITRLTRAANLGLCFHEASLQTCEINDLDIRSLLSTIAKEKIEFVEDVIANTVTAPEKITVFGHRPALEAHKSLLERLPLDLSITFSGPLYLEVTSRGVSKGRALTSLAEYLGLALKNVAAIGDQQNDLSMFEVAGLAIAMGNAPEDVKTRADVIAPTNDEGGLAWALNQIVANQNGQPS